MALLVVCAVGEATGFNKISFHAIIYVTINIKFTVKTLPEILLLFYFGFLLRGLPPCAVLEYC